MHIYFQVIAYQLLVVANIYIASALQKWMLAHYFASLQLIWYSLLYLVAGFLLAGIVKGGLKDEKKRRVIVNIVCIVDLFAGIYLIVNQIGGSSLLLLFAGATVRLVFLGDSQNVKEELDKPNGHFAEKG